MLVSIIVPVYKAEQWLHRCIDSILDQTMPDFELLLINDGSPDKSGEICDEYATKDSRVRVFHKENGGVSSARNLGLDNAQGEWISFIDADDWVEKEYLEGLTERLDADFIIGGMRNTRGDVYALESQSYLNYEIGKFIELYNGECFVRASWGKLMKRIIIEDHNLRFDEKIRWGEDTVFNKFCFLNSENIRLVEYTWYNYYIAESNIIQHKYLLSFEELEYVLDVIDGINKKLSIKASISEVECKMSFVLLLKFDEIKRIGIKEYYDLCKRYCSSKNYEIFYTDNLLSPIIKGIILLKEYYNKEDINRSKDFFFQCVSLFKDTPWFIKFKYKDFYLWYFLIKIKQWKLLNLLMNFYFKLKKYE